MGMKGDGVGIRCGLFVFIVGWVRHLLDHALINKVKAIIAVNAGI